jgi:hypothetical protein
LSFGKGEVFVPYFRKKPGKVKVYEAFLWRPKVMRTSKDILPAWFKQYDDDLLHEGFHILINRTAETPYPCYVLRLADNQHDHWRLMTVEDFERQYKILSDYEEIQLESGDLFYL